MESARNITRIQFDCLTRAEDQGLPVIEYGEVDHGHCSDADLVFEPIATDQMPFSALPAVVEH